MDFTRIKSYCQNYYEIMLDTNPVCSVNMNGTPVPYLQHRITMIQPFQVQEVKPCNQEPRDHKGFGIIFKTSFLENRFSNNWADKIRSLEGAAVMDIGSAESVLYDLAAYASALHITPKHLGEMVSEFGGNTAIYIINEARLNYAKSQLREGVKPVNQIAAELSFEDLNYFSTFFKRLAGVSPTEVRKKQSFLRSIPRLPDSA